MTMTAGPKSGALSFPNQCRGFDATRNRVQFWGYDTAIEISFFVTADALRKLSPAMSGTEAGVLEAFDGARERIHKVADKVYERGHKESYVYLLTAADF